MDISEKQYMALSEIAYANFEYSKEGKKLKPSEIAEQYGESLSELDTKKLLDKQGEPVKEYEKKLVLTSVADWKLVAYQNKNDTTGFCASAYENPDGQLVFAFRGTEPRVTDHTGILPEDAKPDALIGLSQNFSQNLPEQFNDTKSFIKATLAQKYNLNPDMSDAEMRQCVTDNNVTSTGHSLGGGLSEYFTYLTGGKSVTFNGVGIGQDLGLTPEAAAGFNAVNITNGDDFVGHFGLHLGQVRNIKGTLGPEGNLQDIVDVITEIRTSVSIIDLMNNGSKIKTVYDNLDGTTKEYLSKMFTEAHGMQTMLQGLGDDGNFNNPEYVLEDGNQGRVQKFCDELLKCSQGIVGPVLHNVGVVDIAQGVDYVNDANTLFQRGINSFVAGTDEVINKNMQVISTNIQQILSTGKISLEQDIVNCSGDVGNIKDAIILGAANMSDKIATVLDASGNEVADGINETVAGLVSMQAFGGTYGDIPVAGYNIDAVQDIQRIENGLQEAREGIAASYNGIKDTVYQELCDSVDRLKPEVSKLCGDVSDINETVDKSVTDIKTTIADGLDNIGKDIDMQVAAGLDKMKEGFVDLGQGGMHIAQGAEAAEIMNAEAASQEIQQDLEAVNNWVDNNVAQPAAEVAKAASQEFHQDLETANNWVNNNVAQPAAKVAEAASQEIQQDLEAVNNWANDNVAQPAAEVAEAASQEFHQDLEAANNWVDNNVAQPAAEVAEAVENKLNEWGQALDQGTQDLQNYFGFSR